MKRRNHSVIKANAVHHIYQNTPKGYLIFYSIKDYLVFYSIVSVVAKRYGIQILGICPMVDHTHLLVYVRDPEVLHAFVRDYTSLFALKYNKWYGFKGPLFNTPFGCAPKLGHKKVRTAIAYVYNNPVECHLFERAELARWNFLAYAAEIAPFSEKLRMDYARWDLRKALKWVKVSAQSGSPLEYAVLDKTTRTLSLRELRQFVDYVVRQYSCIDYDALINYYGTYDDLVRAINSNTGSEYDIEEDTFAKDHRVYKKMIARLCNLTGMTMKDLLALPYEERSRLGQNLRNSVGASAKEVVKLLRL
jgi:REP element-mobilizing transposase RayT